MLRIRFVLMAAFCCAGSLASGGLFHRGDVAAQNEARLELHESRADESDLEVRGLRSGGPRFVTRASLEALEQVEAVLRPSEDFTEVPKAGVRVSGVPLEVLERALGVAAGTAVEGVCSDGYTAPFPAEYVRQHRPIFVLKVNGMTPKAWAEKSHTSDLGPYFIAYDNFVPAFHVLAHADRPQDPVQLAWLEFAPEKRMFAAILPAWTEDATVGEGYRIAQQNCFRCHNAAEYGGTKSGRNWTLLGKDARERPDWFAKWVHEPKSVDAKAEMPPNPRYDRATLAALTKYFSTMK